MVLSRQLLIEEERRSSKKNVVISKIFLTTKFYINNMYFTTFNYKLHLHKNYVFTDSKSQIKMNIDKEILITIDRINVLLELNILAVKLRLAGMLLGLNKSMKAYNGNKKYLRILYQNIPGTLSTFNMTATIESLLDRLEPDVIALAEPVTVDLDHDWGPYELVCGRNKNGKNVRLHALIKNNIKYKQETWDVPVPNLSLNICGWKFIFCYREWAHAGDQSTKSLPDQLSRWKEFVRMWGKEKGRKTICIGDFNFDFWTGSKYQRQLNDIRDLVMEDIVSKGWYQLIKTNTRYQNQSSSCLDHVYSRTMDGIQVLTNENHTGYDHNCVGVQVSTMSHAHDSDVTYYRDISGITCQQFESTLANLNLSEVYFVDDTSEAAELLTHKINAALEQLSPMKKRYRKSNSSADWLTPELRDRINIRNGMRRKFEGKKGGQEWKEFVVYRNRLKTDMLKQKKEWIKQRLTRLNGDSKDQWRQLKSAMEGKRVTNNIVLKVNGQLLDKPEQVAKHLNEYFVEKVNKIVKDFPPDQVMSLTYTDEYVRDKSLPSVDMEFQPVSCSQVLEIIANLKNTTAVGHDMVSTQVLKKFAKVIAHPLTHVINRSIMTCNYPQVWKRGVISPVPKKGDLTQDKNWRPVTLLPIMSKVFEKEMNKQLKFHLESCHLLGPGQHAYRSHKSCQTALVDLDAKILRAVDQGYFVGLLLVDMSAAFNVVAKEIVVPKLRKLGVGEYATRLIASYLSKRTSRVKVKGKLSEWIMVLTGIGEGSVIGPLIFIITIICVTMVLARSVMKLKSLNIKAEVDDGSKNLDTDVKLSSTEFVDDVTGVTIARTEDLVQKSLQIMADEYKLYFGSNGLKINVEKCEHIVIGAARSKTIVVDGRVEADQVKLLGVTFNKFYKFDKHVDGVVAKISARNGQLSKIANLADQQTTKMVANAVVNSVAQYGCEVYGKDPKQMNRIQVKLNNTMRITTHAKRRTRINDMLRELDWLKMVETVQFNKTMLLHKILSTQAAPYCTKMIHEGMMSHQTKYPVRQVELRIAWNPRHARTGSTSFIHTAVKLYNQVKIMGKKLKTESIRKHVKSIIKSWR